LPTGAQPTCPASTWPFAPSASCRDALSKRSARCRKSSRASTNGR
jgi:hypothetical protein